MSNMTAVRRALCLAGAATVTGAASAAEVLVTNDIATSTTWTADNTYNLQNQIYVLPGATLTVEAGTVIASTPTANGSGSLAVTRGARIFVNGTAENPVIMTSTADVATWDGSVVQNGSVEKVGDPTTGEWREAANEWGNLTIMGNAYVSNSFVPGNTSSCNADNLSPMEGLVAEFPGDPNVLYGGDNDHDDSGSISHLSIRYGGRVVGLANELNGLSLGGIGRGTDIEFVEIMNNVDDGIEIWGGTVDLKYFNIWNVGDDSLDVDQGWRGRAQFGLIVQGYSVDASQGSGVGDNAIETDGAEDSDAQPVTTAAIYNVTVVGQPVDGDGGTTWRDNARIQYRKCVFMDVGDGVVRFDNLDGDGSQGYGFNGTLGWPQTWTTPFDRANNCAQAAYLAQSQGDPGFGQGFLAEITDSVFFRNTGYDQAVQRGVLLGTAANPQSSPGKANVLVPGFEPADAPITSLTRQTADADGDGLPGVTRGGKIMLRVLSIDPRAANEAATCMTGVPDDGFFCPVDYRGAFGPDENWLCGWSATDAFGFLATPDNFCVTPEPCPAIECPADLDASTDIGVSDLLQLLAGWGECAGCAEDLDGDNIVGVSDLLELLAGWGPCE